MKAGASPHVRLTLVVGLFLPLLAVLAFTPGPASAAGDTMSVQVQTCTLPVGLSCDPGKDAYWSASATTYGSEVWWRVVVTNGATSSDPLTKIIVSSSLPTTTTDCFGPVPVPGNSLAPGASYSYVCQTTGITPPTTVTQTVSAVATPLNGTPNSVSSLTSAPSIATVAPATPPPGASISGVLQICTLAIQASCDPTQPINGVGWASVSGTVNQPTVRWRVFITNTGTLPLTTLDGSESLPPSNSDCAGFVPPNSPAYTGTLAAGASYAYECNTFNVTQTTTNTVTVTAFPSPYPSGAPVTSLPSSATALVYPSIPAGLAITSDNPNSVGLGWNSSTGGATGYTIYRNGTEVGTTNTTSYTDSTIAPSTTEEYTVDAFNAMGLHSAQSTPVLVTTPAAVVTSPSTPITHGYWLVGSDGGIFSFNAPFFGSTGNLTLQRPVVGIVPTKDHGGYWLDASDGGVFAFGATQFYGSIPGLGIHPYGSGSPHSLNAPIVGMVPSADQGGYFMVASDGGVFAFGSARFAGSCYSVGGCAGAAVDVMPDASGNGYWLVTQTGSIYAFGDAGYFGAPGNTGSPVTSAVRTPDGSGYWVLTANGNVFAYGDALNAGGAAGAFGGLNPANAIFTTSDNSGYWIASANGSVVPLGGAPNQGSMVGTRLTGSIIAATGF